MVSSLSLLSNFDRLILQNRLYSAASATAKAPAKPLPAAPVSVRVVCLLPWLLLSIVYSTYNKYSCFFRDTLCEEISVERGPHLIGRGLNKQGLHLGFVL